MRRFIFTGFGDDLSEYLYVYDALLGTKKLVLTYPGFMDIEEEHEMISSYIDRFMIYFRNEKYFWIR